MYLLEYPHCFDILMAFLFEIFFRCQFGNNGAR